ncbi:hypothetical protein COJ85_21775 [Bacillus sp. AFS076308]|uniref:DUF3231 family protein n=1 Tax=unclassified Bacillus (in: firmicutes) TaxID=185979 RepID=UPI000BF4084D|nr:MULTISPECIES: DUF3231 family protein [unclassified Bacillus (in: firmicutes)]PFN98150.1 hypothetical protein COJ85_21775 [Bacillus sp. AFS076308]PGV50865.1 hypothetical protein COD92_16395 [Bacillus sp. AFS037270]
MQTNKVLKPLKLSPNNLKPDAKLTAPEMGKLWATYVGNSMSSWILRYFLKHVDDEDIRLLLENGLSLSEDFMQRIEQILSKENYPIPIGFTKDDVNLGAPRLFQDEFYVHYLKYAAKAALSLYNVAIPLVLREDIRDFFIYCNVSTITFLGQLNDVLMIKGLNIKPPILPIPEKVDFIKKQNYLKGFLGDVRSLHALEITHLYDNIENNTTSKALLIAFSQVAKDEEVRQFLIRGNEITDRSVKQYSEKLQKDNLPFPTQLDHLVTESTFSPFSDKLMVFHKVDMFSMKIRSFGNSIAVNGRRDIGSMYMRSLAEMLVYVEDGANILIENGWMEEPPKAADRSDLASNKS